MLNLDQYTADYARLHASYERQAYPIFKRALDTQTKAVAAYVQANGVTLLSLLLPTLLDPKPMQEAYLQVYTEIGVRHARNYSRLLDRILQPQKHNLPLLESKAVAFSSEFWRTIMEQFFREVSSTKISQVEATTTQRIRDLLGEAQQQNLSTTQQARYLTEKLQDSRFNATRAMMIARTESTVGSNRAAAEVAARADFQLNKVWVAALDSRTRNSHRTAAKQEPIDLNAYFEVPNSKGGIELALHPGDSRLSAENCVNCRCVLAHQPVLDAVGLPIPLQRTAPVAAAAMAAM